MWKIKKCEYTNKSKESNETINKKINDTIKLIKL